METFSWNWKCVMICKIMYKINAILLILNKQWWGSALLFPLLLLPLIEHLLMQMSLIDDGISFFYLPLSFWASLLLLYGWLAFPGLFISFIYYFYHLLSLNNGLVLIHLYLLTFALTWLSYSYTIKNNVLTYTKLLLIRLFFFTILLPVLFIVNLQCLILLNILFPCVSQRQSLFFPATAWLDGLSILLNCLLMTPFFHYCLRCLQHPRLLCVFLLKMVKGITNTDHYHKWIISLLILSGLVSFYFIYIKNIHFNVEVFLLCLFAINFYLVVNWGYVIPLVSWPLCNVIYATLNGCFFWQDEKYLLFFLLLLFMLTILLFLFAFYQANQHNLLQRLKQQEQQDNLFQLANLQALAQDIQYNPQYALCLLLLEKLQPIRDLFGIECYLPYWKKLLIVVNNHLYAKEKIYILPNGNLVLRLLHRQFPERLIDLQAQLNAYQQQHFPYACHIGISYSSLKVRKESLSSFLEKLTQVAKHSLLTGKIEYYRHYDYLLWQQERARVSLLRNIQRGIYHNDFLVNAQAVLSRQGDGFYSLTLLTYSMDGSSQPISQLMPAIADPLPRYPLDTWLLQRILQFMIRYRQQLASLRFIIPLSLQTVLDGQFLPQLSTALRQYPVETYQLIVRIKLSEKIQQLDVLQNRLTALYQMGCFIMLEVMDQQTINYQAMTLLPYDFLLVSADHLPLPMATPGMLDFTQEVVRLAQQQQKTVVVQDVENIEQLTCAQQMGIDYWQGNYIAQAKSLDELLFNQNS